MVTSPPLGTIGKFVPVSTQPMRRWAEAATSEPPVTAEAWKISTEWLPAFEVTAVNATSAASAIPSVTVFDVRAELVTCRVPELPVTSDTHLWEAEKVYPRTRAILMTAVSQSMLPSRNPSRPGLKSAFAMEAPYGHEKSRPGGHGLSWWFSSSVPGTRWPGGRRHKDSYYSPSLTL